MKIGILGGGQLSKMLALAGISMGFDFVFYFPKNEHCLHKLGKIINGSYDDFKLLNEFAQQVDVITYENENIPLSIIEHLMQLKPVFPDSHALAVSQDRLIEKNFFLRLGIPTNQFIEINKAVDIKHAAKQLDYPLIIKKRKQGYDGKGQFKFNNEKEIKEITKNHFYNAIAEE